VPAGNVLVVNTGSSSLKLSLLDPSDLVLFAADLAIPDGDVQAATAQALAGLAQPVHAVGHRVVHGGDRYTGPVLVDPQVRERLEALVPLAPLHQPAALAGLDAATRLLPGVPNVACFDTAFHATLPPAAHTYPVPASWRDRYGLRRYGFHGLSHAHVAHRVSALADTGTAQGAAQRRLVSCHLGAGASLAAIRGGRCIDTTMGFTPLDGLMMATRSGSIDPGAVLWLLRQPGMSAADVEAGLEHESGFVGLTGSADQRQVLEAGDPVAQLAVDVYLHRLRAGIAAMAAALGGLDVLAFTGGVGEHAPVVRARAAAGLAFLGIGVDAALNSGSTEPAPDREIGSADARVRTFVVRAREDLQIAREVRRVSLGPG
jgi:acetate kinase